MSKKCLPPRSGEGRVSRLFGRKRRRRADDIRPSRSTNASRVGADTIRPRGMRPDTHHTPANPHDLKICHCEERKRRGNPFPAVGTTAPCRTKANPHRSSETAQIRSVAKRHHNDSPFILDASVKKASGRGPVPRRVSGGSGGPRVAALRGAAGRVHAP